MSIHYPTPIQPGDVVALVAPSSGVHPEMHDRLEAAVALLRAKGFHVREGALVRQQTAGASASVAERACEFMEALLNDSVAAVLPPWGGELAIEILSLLDFDRLALAKPKWISGFSDISTIQLPLLLRSKWASIHGPNLMQLPVPDLSAVSECIFEAWLCGPS